MSDENIKDIQAVQQGKPVPEIPEEGRGVLFEYLNRENSEKPATPEKPEKKQDD